MMFQSFVDFQQSIPLENLVYVSVLKKSIFLAFLWLEETKSLSTDVGDC